ncbi:hypothetical protein G9A89_000509, partial [Geosiphon pyriformis]
VWEITKGTRTQRRRAILDIISGSTVPDIRFLLKTQFEDTIKTSHVKLVADLQKGSIQLSEGMWLRQKDFENIGCKMIRQCISKKRYVNDKYQLTFLSVLQDADGVVTQEDSLKLKHLSWKKFEAEKNVSFNRTLIIASIQETVEFAREIVKAVGEDSVV